MRFGCRVRLVCLVAGLSLVGCGSLGDDPGAADGEPRTLPVGATSWDANAPAWWHDGVLHVGEETLELGDEVDTFVLGATGAYWLHGRTLSFAGADGSTAVVGDVSWGNLGTSADHTVLALVDQSRGPTDQYGTHVAQVVAYDTRTGEELYRTPDEEPEEGSDLADLYEETMPLLQGVGSERVFFDGLTIRLSDGSTTPASRDADAVEVYAGHADTLFHDGYPVSIRVTGDRLDIADSTAYGVGRLSPDRSTIFDVTQWPAEAVAYEATTGARRDIDAPWRHFVLGGWSDESTFFGAAQLIDPDHRDGVLRASQVVSCGVRALECHPVSAVIRTRDGKGHSPDLLLEGESRR